MNMRLGERALAEYFAKRSACKVQVGAVLSDNWGIFRGRWNHPGPNCEGAHAEAEALKKVNRKRLTGAKITVAAFRNGKMILARPCEAICLPLLKKYKLKTMEYTTKEGVWKTELI